MFNQIWKFILYVFSGRMSEEHLETYIQSKNPRNDAERLDAIREYCRMRGGF